MNWKIKTAIFIIGLILGAIGISVAFVLPLAHNGFSIKVLIIAISLLIIYFNLMIKINKSWVIKNDNKL